MIVELGMVIVIIAIAACGWLAYSALTQIKQLRTELDETQRQVNELKAAAEVVPDAPAPPLPKTRTRSSGLDDLREQLRAAHREETGSEE